ncbi:MAG: nucleotidyltransferase domain-containing protein [Candidatus Bathyarchaeia archaeon]
MTVQRESKGYLAVAERVKAIVHGIDPSARVYLFGSTVRGEATAMSDIDILVVTEMVRRKYDIMVKVYKALKGPLELHIVDKAMFDGWYRRFIPREELVEV